MDISIIICSNLINDYFYKAIDSLNHQIGIQDYEIIIVLNGESKTEYSKIINFYTNNKRIKIYSSEIEGLTHSLNMGIEYASAKYIARMDADDVCGQDRLITQYNYLENNPEVSVCGSNYSLIDEGGNLIRHVVLPENDKQIKRALFFRNPICHPSVMYRRDLVVSAGGYSGSLHAEDYDLWTRLCLKKVKFYNIQKNLLSYRSISSGTARGALVAYAAVSATQWKAFILSRNPLWLLGSFISLMKGVLFSKK